MYRLRRAEAKDAKAIRRLIYAERLNPFGLDWRRFWLAIDEDEHIIGCGQVKPHFDGSRELASIAVQRKWRRRGVASAIIRQLLAENPPPLYLTCRTELTGFYTRFGFDEIEFAELPPYFRWTGQWVRILHWFTLGQVKISILGLK
ncbi:MAG: GNAT family N-acetyltransferase [Thermanaerothrix sp.]|uniref:GNAT family N-acetyltransferase n=1 Tax=Thermanaerothrix sp. TaxID=2972675 RepID=UPI003C7E3316